MVHDRRHESHRGAYVAAGIARILKRLTIPLAYAFLIIGTATVAWEAVKYYQPTIQNAVAEANNDRQRQLTNILSGETVAYYTKVLAIFTGALSAFGALQGVLIYQQIKLGRDEFNATHRPVLIVRDVSYVDDVIQYLLINSGTGPATIVESWILVEFPNDERNVRNIWPAGHDSLGKLVLAPGEPRLLTYTPTEEERLHLNEERFLNSVPSAERLGRLSRYGHLHFTGAIPYQDPSGARRLSVFRRIYSRSRGFQRPRNPDHEYAD
jgi:hypothetical protein